MQYFDTNNKTKHFHDAERFPQAINISSYFRMVLFCSMCYFHSLKRFPMKNSLNNRGQFWTKQRQQEHKEAVLNEWFLQFHRFYSSSCFIHSSWGGCMGKPCALPRVHLMKPMVDLLMISAYTVCKLLQIFKCFRGACHQTLNGCTMYNTMYD